MASFGGGEREDGDYDSVPGNSHVNEVRYVHCLDKENDRDDKKAHGCGSADWG